MAKKRPYWLCKSCGQRLERTRRKCDCGKARPKPRVPLHAQTLRDDDYEVYHQFNKTVHGVEDESCGVCRRPRSQERRHDRDHGHLKGDPAYGKPRGLACVRCNRIMVRELDYELSRRITEYLGRVQRYYLEEARAA